MAEQTAVNRHVGGSSPPTSAKEEWMSGLNHLTANEEYFGTAGSNPASSAKQDSEAEWLGGGLQTHLR